MKQELDDYLCNTFPKIFAQRNDNMQTTAMCWGFECGDGWFNIINQLCKNIQSHIDWSNRDSEIVPQVVAVQVKEKFGDLRFYYEGGDEQISGMVRMAESMSGVTCEECGDVGAGYNDGWIKTLCETHIAERRLRREKQ